MCAEKNRGEMSVFSLDIVYFVVRRASISDFFLRRYKQNKQQKTRGHPTSFIFCFFFFLTNSM